MRNNTLKASLFTSLLLLCVLGSAPASADKNALEVMPYETISAESTSALAFDLICHPFKNLEKQRPIDSTCGRAGSARPKSNGQPGILSASSRAQNLIKNNFCAGNPVGQPKVVPITSDDFVALQKAAEKKGIGVGEDLSPNRSGLLNIIKTKGNIPLGEKALVSYIGFVIDARHSDSAPFDENGETVNCNSAAVENNDIHIELGQTPNDDPCETVTAEISPHFRPDVWDRFDSNEATKDLVNGLPVEGLIVRMTGQLFFDGSHEPCRIFFKNGKRRFSRRSPARISTWEIHPVYAIDVCTSKDINVCRNDPTKFIPVNEWAKNK